jgi:hypothetical protein
VKSIFEIPISFEKEKQRVSSWMEVEGKFLRFAASFTALEKISGSSLPELVDHNGVFLQNRDIFNAIALRKFKRGEVVEERWSESKPNKKYPIVLITPDDIPDASTGHREH